MKKNILLAFVSPVNTQYLNKPINYKIHGQPYAAIQTNEAAIVFAEWKINPENSLAKIFLIASDRVKCEKILLDNEFGDVTHLEFLQRRITKIFPYLSDKFSVHDYSDTGDNFSALEKNILQTAEIADAVMNFARENPADEIIVHADMTGGFRHASMLMLSIIQLLKYRGVEIGEVLYSDPTAKIVYSVTEIQRMFSLIAGADEFVKFGSVDALRDYFGDNPPHAVKDLLEAMNRFSEAIKICRTSAIENELKNLGQHIKTFRKNPDKDLRSKLFAKIIDTIEIEYGNLLSDKPKRLEIIRWCMRKGFWQQAMTLCTEWLPEEIVRRKICLPKNSSVAKIAELEGIPFGRNWQQQFIIAYQGSQKIPEKITDAEVADFAKILRNILENFPAKKIPDEKIFAELKVFFREYAAAKNIFERCCRKEISVNNFKNIFPTIAAALQIIYDERKINSNYVKNFYDFIATVNYDKLPITVAKILTENLFKLFHIDCENIPKKIPTSEKKWENRKKIYLEMFGKKIIYSKFDEQIALKFLQGYYEIRNERNQVNHANIIASKKISDLKPMIENYLDALEKLQ